jgi:hypothetical protein
VVEEAATERASKIVDRQRSTLRTETHPGKARAVVGTFLSRCVSASDLQHPDSSEIWFRLLYQAACMPGTAIKHATGTVTRSHRVQTILYLIDGRRRDVKARTDGGVLLQTS